MRTITLEGERPTSWNKYYSGKHWSKRAIEANRVHLLVQASLHFREDIIPHPVEITVTVYFKSRALDACNIPAKLYIDGLIGYWLTDDNPKFVRSVTTIPKLDKHNPRVVIDVIPARTSETQPRMRSADPPAAHPSKPGAA